MAKHRNTRIKSSPEVRALFGSKLKNAIRDANMNQSDLARRMDVTKDAISSYVRGRSLPNDEALAKIGAILQVDIEYLLPRRYDTAPNVPTIKLESIGDNSGRYFLRVNIVVDLEEANKIISLIPRGADILPVEEREVRPQ